ncbi:winged helix DNA-binding domain-containing protein [Nocardioides sp. InS609-2]|uniref:winged helix DNA-binding domain-containing protein n=1 Tax=Nocardioides sp. InS609-2 TaxID=2760705 RepID=UPI0020C186E8|nr:winged helix DNA-binding domain-containing protein [Nocardioides sp. InS609-2]
MPYEWSDLAGLALARQFPETDGSPDVAAMLQRIGPIQSQTARSPYVALAARFPDTTLADISAAYDELRIVRGSTLRGTVHTSTPDDHVLLESATRVGQRTLWQRTIRPADVTLEQVWAGIEEFASADWRTPVELDEHLHAWLAEHDPSGQPRIQTHYFAFGHGGLVRRPLSGGWEGQGKPGYRSAAAALLGDRSDILGDPDSAMDALVRRHLACHGPASRRDLAWWAGVGLRVVDASLARLDLLSEPGPDRLDYFDLPSPPAPVSLPGVRLLPEFDALLCAYDPPARARFVSPGHYQRLWSQDNGLLLAPLLVDGRLTGYWRLPGSGARRACAVAWFGGTRRPTKAELESPIAAVEAAYGVTVTSLSVTRD